MDTIDILGAYINTDSNEYVIMLLKGRMVYLLASIDTKLYRKYVVIEKGVKVPEARLKNALH